MTLGVIRREVDFTFTTEFTVYNFSEENLCVLHKIQLGKEPWFPCRDTVFTQSSADTVEMLNSAQVSGEMEQLQAVRRSAQKGQGGPSSLYFSACHP